MTKRFKQFLLENEIRYDNNDSTIENMIESLSNGDSSRMIIAKFVLYCIEDVFQFNNDTTRESSKQALELIRQYINNPQSVTRQELINTNHSLFNIANNVYAITDDIYHTNSYSDSYFFWNAAYHSLLTANTAIQALSYSFNGMSYAADYVASTADFAAWASYNANANIDEKIREQKLNEYKQYLNMLTARYHHSDENTFNKINQLTQNKPQTEEQWFSFLTQIIDELEIKNIIRQLPNGSAELHLPFANIHANSQLELIDIISRNERIRDLIYSWFV